MVAILRPLSIGELLDRTFHLYRNNFFLFVGIAAIPQLFVLALQLGDSAILAARFFAGAGVANLLIGLVSLIAIEASHAGTAIAVSSLQLEKPTGIGLAYASARSSLLRVIGISFIFLLVPTVIAMSVALIGAAIAVAIAVGVAFALHGGIGVDSVPLIPAASVAAVLLIPLVALRWWLAWALAVPVTVLEGSGVRASFRRSKELAKASKSRIFVICFLMLLLTWVVSSVIQLPFIALAGWRSMRDPGSLSPLLHAIQAACVFLSTSLVGPLLTIALTLIYYDQRVRKEGFDLQLLIANLEPH